MFAALGLNSLDALSQIRINELQHTNASTWADETGDYGDWFELYNAGSEAVWLEGWQVSDGGAGWLLPPTWLAAGAHRVIFASGRNIWGTEGLVHHLEWPVSPGVAGAYLVPSAEPPAAWRLPGYDASAWATGPTGMGFGDGDDGTAIPAPALSVYVRVPFVLSDPGAIASARLMMDYDDGIVCWLNGVEIGRAMVGTPGDFPGFQTPASGGHEAVGYQGGTPDSWALDPAQVAALVQVGENVLSWQVHNVEVNSSDLTGNVWLELGMSTAAVQTLPAPPSTLVTTPSHTDFGLSTGETLTLLDPEGEAVDAVAVPVLDTDHVYRRVEDGAPGFCVATAGTPGQPNGGECAPGYAEAPELSLPGGTYSAGVYVELTSPTAGGEIRYTADGSVPTAGSPLYTGPLSIAGTTVLSVRTFAPGYLPSRVRKQTYLIGEEGLGLPVVSLSCDPDHLWHPETGIHVFGPPDYQTGVPFWGANFWEDWERPAYVEYFSAQGAPLMSGPVGVKIHGGWSRSREQKSLRVQAKGRWGMEDLAYPLIPDKGHIPAYKGINLRNGGNDYDQYRFHDALLQRVLRTTHVDYMAYAPSVVFLNGEYWGFMELRENLDQHYVASNHAIDAEDVTLLSMNYMGVNVISGEYDDFLQSHAALTSVDPTTPGYWDLATAHLDIENYIDYIIAQTYWCNGDWSWGYQNNTKLWFDRRPGGKWRFMLMDLDFGMGLAGNSPTDDYIVAAGDDGLMTDQIFAQLKQNATFRTRFINRYADLINTVFQAEAVTEMAHAMRDEVAPAFDRHRQRWNTNGDALWGVLESRLDWAEQRVNGARQVVQNHFALPGQVQVVLDVEPAGAGRIQISTIAPNSDAYPWTGVYFRGVPVQVTAIPEPGFTFSHWTGNAQVPAGTTASALELMFEGNLQFQAVFSGAPAGPNPLSVSELMFHPDDATPTGDWLELRNNLDVPLDLSGWRITDSHPFGGYVFPLGTLLPPGGHAVVAEDGVAFQAVHPNTPVLAGSTGMAWSNSGDQVAIYRPNGSVYLAFEYSDADVGLDCSDGGGYSREHAPASHTYGPLQWFLGCEGGSPGEAWFPCPRPVVVSELFYDAPAWASPGDWVELHVPPGQDPVDLSGWVLRDGGGNAYVFPQGAAMGPGEYKVVARSPADFALEYDDAEFSWGPLAFGWSAGGDEVMLYDAQGKLRYAMGYGVAFPWPVEAAGGGAALVYQGLGHPCSGSSWFASCPLGSPGVSDAEGCGTVAVQESQAEEGWRWAGLAPNPTTDWVQWTAPGDFRARTWRWTSADGKTLATGTAADTRTLAWDLSQWTDAPGIYLCEIFDASGMRWVGRALLAP
jgi:hypothetical protein